MSAAGSTKQDEDGQVPGTLGEVLYGPKTAAPVPEGDWVALIVSIAGGDQRSLHALYDRAHRIVYTLAVRITNNRDTAEEVTLDVFHDVWRRASSYDAANGTVIGWIMNQARSRAIDRVRLEQRKKRVNQDPGSPVETSQAPGPHEALEFARLQGVLRNALLRLTPEERRAIETAYFSGLTYAEAAQRLNQPLGTIKTRIRSGLAKLRKALPENTAQ